GDADATNDSLTENDKGKGGFRACIFIYVYTALDNMGFMANMVSLVIYFYTVMFFDIPSAANALTNFIGTAYLLSLLGAFISDTYLNKFRTIMIFGTLEIMGLVLVTVQAYSKELHPLYCGKSTCVEGGVAVMLYFSLYLLALGAGGIRGALLAFGADQFDENVPTEVKAVASYFNWVTFSTVLGATIGVTGIVYLSVYRAWYKGFIVSTVGTFLGLVTLAAGKPFYRLQEPGQGPLLSVAQVVVLAIKNWNLPLPESANDLYEIHDEEVSARKKLEHTDQFRFLDKAAILHKDLEPAPWKVCSVTQVEEVKILTRMLPILGSTIIMNTCVAQLLTFSVEQGNTMDLHLGKHLFPAPSIPVISLVFMVLLIPLYELFFVPLARKITGHPAGITQLQRVGVGLVLSAISMTVAGFVEVKRRNQSIKSNKEHPISFFWLSFQYAIFGMADMFTLVGLMEFFYKEAPASMKALSTSFTGLSLSLGYFSSTIIVNIINAITKRVTPIKQGWLHGYDLDSNNLNLFYWFLAILSCLNFISSRPHGTNTKQRMQILSRKLRLRIGWIACRQGGKAPSRVWLRAQVQKKAYFWRMPEVGGEMSKAIITLGARLATARHLLVIASPNNIINNAATTTRALSFSHFYPTKTTTSATTRTPPLFALSPSPSSAFSVMSSSRINGSGGYANVFPLSESSVLKINKGDITQWSVDGSSDAIPMRECLEVEEQMGLLDHNCEKHAIMSLKSVLGNSMTLARDNNIKYIAFPAISCGVFGYPFDEAATVAISTVKEFENDVKEVHFVLFSDEIYDTWLKKAKELLHG
ncbi:hypothetical protein Tsubulata_025365, partial [Turnera subulata]